MLIEVMVRDDGIRISGHAGYAESGKDIVCSAVSVLVQTLVKSIDDLTDDRLAREIGPGIQRSGRNLAINKTDEKLISGIQKEIKRNFYALLETGTGTASGNGLQAALSAAWGAVKKFYEDEDATPIFFVSSDDVADYLGKAQVIMQTAFGMSYIQDFLGLGTVVISPTLTKGKLIATAKENLRGAYIPANSGDLAESFGLTADATGLIGMTHVAVTENASVETLMVSGVIFYPEFLDGVVVSTIGSEAGSTPDSAEKVYTEEELSALTVEKIKGLAAFRGYTIMATTKDEIIQEFLTQQG